MNTKAAYTLIAFILAIITYFSLRYYLQTKDKIDYIYNQSFTSSLSVNSNTGVLKIGECQNGRFLLRVTETTATLSVQGDIMSGKVIKVTEDNVLIVEFDDKTTLGFFRVFLEGETDEILVIFTPHGQIILSNDDNCEKITQFLDKNR